jgi:hypothetical protein
MIHGAQVQGDMVCYGTSSAGTRRGVATDGEKSSGGRGMHEEMAGRGVGRDGDVVS